jgi:hypothetical protein
LFSSHWPYWFNVFNPAPHGFTGGFAAAVLMLRPRAWSAVLAGLLYFPSMFIVIFWIGYRAGYYDLP